MPERKNPASDDACYLALKARDARFDGSFFTGITSTGIYCRPVCRVRTPKRENCRFFRHAAQAEQAGFRPCLRCRPELAPGSNAFSSSVELKAWSMQDASCILAHQAARLMDATHGWRVGKPDLSELVQRLGISDRHLRRIFHAQFGVSPLQYLQTRRLLCAKQLLTDSALPVAQVARISGFASVRSFNATFFSHYGLQPTQLRRNVTPAARDARIASRPGIQITLAWRPPYDVAALLQFFNRRQINGVEVISTGYRYTSLARTLRISRQSQAWRGWLLVRFDEPNCRVHLTVSEALVDVLPEVISRVRALLDLDTDPRPINELLHCDFPDGDGLRLPGTLDGFELAVRAILGQQISVAAARTLCNRLVAQFGEALATPIAGLNRLFPDAPTLAGVSTDVLGQLGIVKQRQRALQALAHAVTDGTLALHPGANLTQTLASLLALPGVGDWTAQYIAMRALAWPDAYAAGDAALHKALGVQYDSHPAKAALAAAKAWQPWRSYAMVRAWATQTNPTTPEPSPKTLLTK